MAPTFQLLQKKALPEFRKLFERWLRLGTYQTNPTRQFTFSADGDQRTHGTHDPDHPTMVYFGYAEDPESLESMTVKAAWLDEAGQKKFRLGSWEAICRRVAVHQGRILITTTPYDLGWLKQQLYDPWTKGDPDIQVVRFDSTLNPSFPKEEFERARRSMPRWKFDLFYRAIFTRPAGMIYDSFDEKLHTCPRFPIPDHWPRFLGLDFGGVHTAAVFYAKEPGSKRLFAYREYLDGGKTAEGHAGDLMAGEPMIPLCVGGSKSEDQWRREFTKARLPVHEPEIKDVEVGINRVWGAHNEGQIMVFSDLEKYLAEKMSYSRELDEGGQPTEEIADKDTYHLMDAERYIIGFLRAPNVPPMSLAGAAPVLPPTVHFDTMGRFAGHDNRSPALKDRLTTGRGRFPGMGL